MLTYSKNLTSAFSTLSRSASVRRLHHTLDWSLMMPQLPSNSFLSINNSSFLGYHPNGAQGASSALNTNSSFSQLASSSANTRSHGAQTLRHSFGRLSFTNKCVG